jgi:DNA-directed RNA polymerase specialized sigma24 family protein
VEHDVIRSPGTPVDTVRAERPPDITELFRERHLELVRLALLIVGDLGTAEDVVQDAFEQLHRQWHTLRRQATQVSVTTSLPLAWPASMIRCASAM